MITFHLVGFKESDRDVAKHRGIDQKETTECVKRRAVLGKFQSQRPTKLQRGIYPLLASQILKYGIAGI